MTKIRVGIRKEKSLEIEIDKPIEEIKIRDIWNVIGESKDVMGWGEIK